MSSTATAARVQRLSRAAPPVGADADAPPMAASHVAASSFSGSRGGRPIVGLGPAVQAKLTVGAAGDRYEREADSVAERVVSGRPAPAISRIPAGGLTSQRACEEHAEADPTAQRQCSTCETTPESAQRVPAGNSEHPQERAAHAAQTLNDTAQAKCSDCGSGAEDSAAPAVQRQEDDDSSGSDDAPDGDELSGARPTAEGEAEARADVADTPAAAPEPAAEDNGEDGGPAPSDPKPEHKEDLGCGGEDSAEAEGEEPSGKEKCGAPAASDAGSAPEPADSGGEEPSPNTDPNEAATGDGKSGPCDATPSAAPAVAEPEVDSAEGAEQPDVPDADTDGSVQRAEFGATVDGTIEQDAQRACISGEAADTAQRRDEPEPAEPHTEAADDEQPGPVLRPGPPARARARANPGVQTDLAQGHIHARGAGEPLPPRVRERIEATMGADLSSVRVHTDGNAQAASRALRAKAFTHRNHIFLGAGHSAHELNLMAHETTHVVQQGAVTQKPGPSIEPARAQPQPAAGAVPAHDPAHGPDHGPDHGPASAAGRPPVPALRAAPLLTQPAAGDANAASHAPVQGGRQTSAHEPRKAQAHGAASAAAGDHATPRDARAMPSPAATAGPAPHPQAVAGVPRSGHAARAGPAAKAGAPGAAARTARGVGPAHAAANTGPIAATSPAGAARHPPPSPSVDTAPPVHAPAALPGARLEAHAVADAPADLRLHGVLDRLNHVSRSERVHEPPQLKVEQAQAAVRHPQDEPASRAQQARVNQMAGDLLVAVPPREDSFVALLDEMLARIQPENIKKAKDFKESGAAAGLKAQVGAAVKAQKTTSVAPLAGALQLPLAGGDLPQVQASSLKPGPPDSAVTDLQAEQALPAPRTEAEVSADGDRDEADRLMADNDIDEDQLRRANEPEFSQALEARQQLVQNTAKVVPAYRVHEATVLGRIGSQLAGAGARALQAMRGTRQRAHGTVYDEQDAVRRREEAERRQLVRDIDQQFGATQRAVKGRLDSLDSPIGLLFDVAETTARAKFENTVDKLTEAFIREALSDGIDWDKLSGFSAEAENFYVAGTRVYVESMRKMFREMARFVEGQLALARQDIEAGRKAIDELVKRLSGKQKTWGDQARERMAMQFEGLEASVEDKKQGLASDITERYRHARGKLDERIEDLRAENRGLFEKFKAFLRRVVEVLKKLKDLAKMLLRAGGEVLRGLIKDPVGFLGNLLAGVKQGFTRFEGRIGEHLMGSLGRFAGDAVAEAGIGAPAAGRPGGLSDVILQVLGIDLPTMKARIRRMFGPRGPELAERAWSLVKELYDDGAAGLWNRLREHAGDVKEQVQSAIVDWVGKSVVIAGLKWVAGLFTPATALVRAVRMIYDVVSFFLSNVDRIAELVNGVLNSIKAVVAGNIAGAAETVENALARATDVLLGFLARLLHLSGLGEKLRTIVERVRGVIGRGIDALLKVLLRPLMWAAGKAGRFVDGAKSAARRAKGAVTRGVAAARRFLFPQRGFTAGGESHRLFFEGEGEKARLMIASRPQALRRFVAQLRKRPENRKGHGKGALDEVMVQLARITRAERTLAHDEQAGRATIDDATSRITALLRDLLTRADYASERNPLPLDYPKHAVADYPTLYLGPRVQHENSGLRQSALKAAYQATARQDRLQALADSLHPQDQEAWEKQGMPIQPYLPTQRKDLPDGSATLGVTPSWQTFVGRRLQLPPTKPGGTPGGKRLNAALAPYGFRAKAELLDGDHVVEIQLGGQDQLENLWPLDRSENRGAGSLVKSQTFALHGGGEVTMDALKARARSPGHPAVWLVITKTR